VKVLVCGKGGCGKSTVVALLSKALANRGYDVLVVDGDESNLGLHVMLGLEKPKEFKELFGSRKEVFEKVKDLNIQRLEDLPEEYVSKKDGIKLLCIGKIHGFGEGCACPMGALLREFLKVLKPSENEFVIVDTEAGIEHFGRAVELGCDLVLVVLDPTYESVMLSKRVEEMKIGRPVFFVLNKVSGDFRDLILSKIDSDRVVAEIPFDRGVFESCLKGEELNLNVEGIERLAEFLIGLKSKLKPEG
jgi:CO dehydrogenase maturation factor